MFTRRTVLRRIVPGAAIGGVLASTPVGPAHAQVPVQGTLLLIEPYRLYDSREVQPAKHATGTAFNLIIPASDEHEGTLLNLTVTETEGAGFVRLGREAVNPPPTSNVNWFADGQTLANFAFLNVAGGVTVQVGGNGRTHILLDVFGFVRGEPIS
jgi:hypothetical protein